MNLLPTDYANFWISGHTNWITYDNLKEVDSTIYLLFANMSVDVDSAIIFISKNLSNLSSTYAIVFCEVLAYKENYSIESISILGYTNESDAEFGLNLSPLAQQIENYQKITPYQFGEKYYIGNCETMSNLKNKLEKVLNFTWRTDKEIIAF